MKTPLLFRETAVFLLLHGAVSALQPGDYSAPVPVNLGTNPSAPAPVVGDFNADGMDDFIVYDANATGPIFATLYLNQGNLNFQNAGFDALPSVPVAAAPIDNTVGDDLVLVPVSAQGGASFYVVPSNGTDGFLDPVEFPMTSPLGSGAPAAYVLDANGDGRTDVMVAMDNQNFETFINNNGTSLVQTGLPLTAPYLVPVRANGGDTIAHIYSFSLTNPVTLETEYTVEILTRRWAGASGWGSSSLLASETALDNFPFTVPLVSGNFNRDMLSDLLTTADGGTVFTQSADGIFAPRNSSAISGISGTIYAVADLDGDGDSDILGNSSGGKLFELTGVAAFTARTTPGNNIYTHTGQFAGDARPDLLLVRNATPSAEAVIAVYGPIAAPAGSSVWMIK